VPPEAVGLYGRSKLPKWIYVEIIRQVNICRLTDTALHAFVSIAYRCDNEAVILCGADGMPGVLNDHCVAAVCLKMLHRLAEDQWLIFAATDFRACEDLRKEMPHSASYKRRFYLIAICRCCNAHAHTF